MHQTTWCTFFLPVDLHQKIEAAVAVKIFEAIFEMLRQRKSTHGARGHRWGTEKVAQPSSWAAITNLLIKNVLPMRK